MDDTNTRTTEKPKRAPVRTKDKMAEEKARENSFLMSPRQVAAHIGVVPETIWRMRKKGEFPQPVKITGKKIGFLRSEVEQWLKDRVNKRDEETA